MEAGVASSPVDAMDCRVAQTRSSQRRGWSLRLSPPLGSRGTRRGVVWVGASQR